MDLNIHNVDANLGKRYSSAATSSAAVRQQAQAEEDRRTQQRRQAIADAQKALQEKHYNPDEYLKDLVTITRIFNRKLRFSIDQQSKQVIVKVIDGETDKVIKEIPSEALQRLHARIRQELGLLIDEQR